MKSEERRVKNSIVYKAHEFFTLRSSLLLSSQSFEEGDDLFEGLEFITSVFDARSHKALCRLWVDEIITIEQLLLVGEYHVVVGWGGEIFLYPCLHLCHIRMVVGWGRSHDVYVVMLDEHLVSLVHRAGSLHVAIVQGIEGEIYDRALLAILLVVYPADDRAEVMECHLVDEAVLAMESDGLWVMLMEDVEGMYHGVFVAKETIYALLLLWCDVLETQGGDVLVFLDETFGNHQLVYAILTRILEFLLARHAAHGVA